jgi:hypothetical protein
MFSLKSKIKAHSLSSSLEKGHAHGIWLKIQLAWMRALGKDARQNRKYLLRTLKTENTLIFITKSTTSFFWQKFNKIYLVVFSIFHPFSSVSWKKIPPKKYNLMINYIIVNLKIVID